MKKMLLICGFILKLWLILFAAVMFAAFINVLVESARQKKSPNQIAREWADKYIPMIQEKAENIRNSLFGY